jgi:hypothetical protein
LASALPVLHLQLPSALLKSSLLLNRLDLNVHASRQIELHQRVHGLLRRLEDVDQRLCVRISKASRDFLSTWGERRTQYLFFIVGSGMGPATWAPVRFAVSTISPVDVSSTR